jgi:hypothetical protein
VETLIKYANSLNASQEIIDWLNTVGKASLKKEAVTVSRLEHIIDWLNSDTAPKRLRRLSIKDAIRLSVNWMELNKRKGRDLDDTSDDIKTFIKFPDGTSIVELVTTSAFKREGALMSHCLGGYSIRDNFKIYSLRDSKNHPHATFEVATGKGEVLQIKGKGNGSIHPKYIFKVLDFLKELKIDIRPSEMKNLGYYEIPEIHFPLVAKNLGKNESIVKINNVNYLV